MHSLIRRPLLLRAIAFSLAAPVFLTAQTLISYTNGQNNLNQINTSAPNDPTTLYITSGSATQNGSLYGTGSVIKEGDGTLTLAGDSTYSGSTTLNHGTLNVAAKLYSGGTTAGSIIVYSGATLALNTQDIFGVHTANPNVRVTINAGGLVTNGNFYNTFTNLTLNDGELRAAGGGSATFPAYQLKGIVTVGGSGASLISSTGAANSQIQLGNNTAGGVTTFDVANANGSSATDLTISAALQDGRDAGGATVSSGLTKTGAGTLTITGNNTYTGTTTISSGTLEIGSGGASGSLTGNIANNAALVFNRSDALTYSGSISGSGTLTKSGAGTLTLTGNNPSTSTFTVSAGTLSIGGGGTTGSFAGNITNNAAVVFNRSDALTYSSAISGSGTLTKTGAGAVTLSAANTYTGNTTVSAGTLVLANTSASPGFAIASGATLELSVASGIQDGGGATFSGTGTLRKTGAGSAYWGGGAAAFALSAGGLIDVQAGNFQASSFANENWTNNFSGLNVASGASFTGAEGNVRVDALTGSGLITSGYSGAGYTAFTFGVGNGSGTFSGVLGNDQYGSVGNYVKAGTGTQTLTGNNTFTGSLTITGGLINFGAPANLGTGAITLNGGGLQWAAGSTTDISPRLAALGASGATFDTNGNNVTLASALGGAGSLTKSGGGTLTLSGANTYTGGTNVSGGTLLAQAGSLGTGSVFLHNGATFDLGGATHALAGLGSAADGLVGNLGNGTVSAPNIYHRSGTTSATLQGTGHLWIGGDSAATVILNGTNNMTSPDATNQVAIGTAVTGSAGTVMLGNPNALAAMGSRVTVNGGVLDLNGQDNVRAGGIDLGYENSGSSGSLVNNDTAHAVSFTGDVKLATLNNIGGAGSLTLGGTVSGASLGKIGSGTLTLTGNNAYTGDIYLYAGTLAVGSATALGSPSVGGNIFFDEMGAGTLQYLSGATTDYSSRLSFLNYYAIYNIDVVAGNSVTFASPLIGGGPQWGSQLNKYGGGTLTLTAVNSDLTATGSGDSIGTYIFEGTLALRGGDNRLPTTAGISAQGGSLDIGAFNQTVTSLQVSNGNILGTGTITVNPVNSAAAGITNGIATANLAGSAANFAFGNATLTGNNTYVANTLITTGTVQVGNGGTTGTLGTGSVSISFGANLAFNRSDALTVANAIDGGGAVTQAGAGTLTLSGANIFGGGLTISSGTVSVASDSNLGYASGTLTFNGGTLQPSASFSSARPITLNTGGGTFDTNGSTLLLSGIISGSGALTKAGAGTLTFSGANTYSGATTINAGTLKLGGDERISNSARLSIASLATFDVNGQMETVGSLAGAGAVTLSSGSLDAGGDHTTTTYSGVMSGLGGSLTKSGAGTMTLSGANSYTGTTMISGGTLLLGAANRLAASSSLTLAGGTFATGGFSQTLGTLKLNGNSTIDFGSGASALVFANSSGAAWSGTLSILNYTSGADTLRVGTSSGGLTAAQLNQISFGGLFAQIDANGFVSPSAIPEPSTYAAFAGMCALGAGLWRRRKKTSGRVAKTR